METIKFLHSYWAYLTLLLILLASANSVIGVFTKKEFGSKDFRIALFALIVTHIQFVLGIILLVVVNDFGDIGMGDLMKSESLRMKNVEHPMLMVIAIALLTIGYSKHKAIRTSSSKFKVLSITYSLALLAILAMIPWSNWIG